MHAKQMVNCFTITLSAKSGLNVFNAVVVARVTCFGAYNFITVVLVSECCCVLMTHSGLGRKFNRVPVHASSLD